MKEREEAWVKIENLAKANPQVLKKRVTALAGGFFTTNVTWEDTI